MKGHLFSYGMKFSIAFSFVIFCFSFSLNAQPKTALSFDGSDDRVDLPSILPASYTKEAWINSSLGVSPGVTNNIISGVATAFWFPADQNFKLSAGQHGLPFTEVQDPTPLLANTWYHVAVTYDAATTTMSLYKNGVMVDQNTSVLSVAETELHLGNYGGFGGTNLFGLMDEVRIWNIALTQTQIRDRMCTKITNTDPLWSNLIAYYNADEGVGLNLNDLTPNNNDGILVNGTTWATSGAAIGDISAYDYTNATKTASLTVGATGEVFTATNTSGSPDGIQVYQVNSIPDNTTGLSNIGGNTRYFGVFQIGGANPTYDAVYDYGTFWGGDETKYRLYKRTDNSAASWSDAGATQDVNTNTLTLSAVTGLGSEYMLGSVGFPLPVRFTSFNVNKEKNGVKLAWSTDQETNNSGFTVQRSSDNGQNWVDLGFVHGQVNSSALSSYNFLDVSPVNGLNLYRLKQIDQNGKSSLSEIRSISYLTNAKITIFPVPASNEIIIDLGQKLLVNTKVKIFDAQGAEIKQVLLTQLQQRIEITDLKNGIYVLQFVDGTSARIVKQ